MLAFNWTISSVVLENYIGGIATVTVTIMLALIGIIYKLTRGEIERHDKKIETMGPQIQQIAADVKHIRAHCVMCRIPESSFTAGNE